MMRNDGKSVDYNEQFYRNISIFKCNFDKILDILVQKVWNKVFDDFETNVLMNCKSEENLAVS